MGARHYFLYKFSFTTGFLLPLCYSVFWKKCFERSPHFIFVTTIIMLKCQRSEIKVLFLNSVFIESVFSRSSIWECSIFFIINEIYWTPKPPQRHSLTQGHNQIFMTQYLFSQIVFIKWEQNHKVLATYINHDYTRL